MDKGLTEEQEQHWCAEQRDKVFAYLCGEGFDSPNVGEWPAWCVAPIISVWAVESLKHPESVGWWAVSGDFPTDYTSCEGERHPRQALRDIGLRWQHAAVRWSEGKPANEWGLTSAEFEGELAPLLASRAQLFLDFAGDQSNWAE